MSRLRTFSPSALLLSALLAGSMALGGCSEAPADGQCQKLLTHLIDLEVQAGQGSDEEKAKQAAELQETMAKSFLERCERDIKAKQIKCSLKATTKKEIEACDK